MLTRYKCRRIGRILSAIILLRHFPPTRSRISAAAIRFFAIQRLTSLENRPRMKETAMEETPRTTKTPKQRAEFLLVSIRKIAAAFNVTLSEATQSAYM